MLTLRRRCGAETAFALAPGAPLVLGRAHLPGAPASISREQCRLVTAAAVPSPDAAGGSMALAVTLTTLSRSAPTLLRCGVSGALEALPPGASRALRHGDAFALCAAAPDDAWFTFAAPRAGIEGVEAASPPTKRGRSSPNAVIDVIDLTAAGGGSPKAVPPGEVQHGGGGGTRPLFLLLSGVPGSGKSTFCAALPPSSWRRVNQDSVAGGKPGSRAQCLAACLAAARAERHVAIDRTHLSEEQRADFISLALLLGAETHCVELALPAALCAQRVLERVDHEGGVQGPAGARTAAMAARGRDNAPPARAEGFAQLTRCRTEVDVARAVARYAAIPPPSAPPVAWREPAAVSALIAAVRAAAEPLRKAAAAANPLNAFQALMAVPARAAPAQAAGGRGAAGGGAWNMALVRAAAAPERTPDVLFHDAALVALRDAYPKATSHTLLIARDPALDDGPAALRAEHAPLLPAMRAAAARVVEEERLRLPALAAVPFRVGFHAVPSMRRLHCHVISGELGGGATCKHKKHWNSFATPFFIQLRHAAAALASPPGRLTLDDHAAEALLRRDLRCHRCGTPAPNMPKLRDHLAQCAAPVPDQRDADF